MRTFLKYILCLVVVCFTSTINAQTTTYPIQLHAVILPPYTNCLGDYVSPGNNRMRLTAIVKDMTRYGKDLKIAVSLKVKMGNTVLLETKSPRPQILNNVGVQTAVETADLFDPTNSYVRGKYAKNGWCLPEGAYEFEFQLFDYYNTKLPLSLPVSMFCYLNQAEPPVGLRPITASDDDCLPTTNPNITFTWMDGVASGLSQKKYTLSVYEVPNYTMVANMFGKQDVAGLVQVVNAQNLTTSTYTVMPTTTFPIEGKSYMWRVSITPDYVAANPDSKSNYTAYKNNGHSQWYAFSYDCKQPEPSKVDLSVKPEIVSFSAVEGDKSAGKVTWKLNDKFCGYILKYQNKEDKEEEWASIDVTNDRVDNEDGTSSYVVKNLAQGETFLAAVVGIVECGENQVLSGESDQKELALEALVVASKNEDDDCKINIDHVQNSDIKELKIGDCFYANGNWVRIETVSYTNGKFTGSGVYSFSFLKNVVGVNVKFTDVKINESRELIEGDVIAVSNKSDNMMININDWTNKSNTGKVDAPQQKDIPTVEMTEEQLEAELAKSSSEYEGKLIQVGDKVYTIEKKDGKLQKVELGTVQDQKTFCPPMVSGVDNENGYVKFSAINKWEPPFDYECNPFCNNVNIHEAYKHEDGYGVPWIAMAQGQTITIKAEFKNGLKSDDVAFYCYTANKTVKLTFTKVENGSCNVTIFAGEPGYALYIFAMKQTNKNSEGDDADCSGTKTFGRAQIFTCAKKDHKIKMVPVFENIAIETDKVQKELNSLYGPLGQTFVVDADGVFNDESIQKYNNNKAFELDETDAFKNESQAMKDLRRAYKKVKGDATNGYDAFIFVLPKRVASNQNVSGEMPRSNSIGYVFTSGSSYDDYRTLSHEIGHGLYSLEHTFSIFKDVAQGSTDNLMDYSSGQNLKYWQWTLVNDPKGYVLPFFDDADDAQNKDENCTLLRELADLFDDVSNDDSWEDYCRLHTWNEKFGIGFERSVSISGDFVVVGGGAAENTGFVFFLGGDDALYPYFYTAKETFAEISPVDAAIFIIKKINEDAVKIPSFDLDVDPNSNTKIGKLKKIINKISNIVSADIKVTISPYVTWQYGFTDDNIRSNKDRFAGKYDFYSLDVAIPIPEFPILKIGGGTTMSTNRDLYNKYYIQNKGEEYNENDAFWTSFYTDFSMGFGLPGIDAGLSSGKGELKFIDKEIGKPKTASQYLTRWNEVALYLMSPLSDVILYMLSKEQTNEQQKCVSVISKDKKQRHRDLVFISPKSYMQQYYAGRNVSYYEQHKEDCIVTYMQPDGNFIELSSDNSVSFVGGTFNPCVINNLQQGVLMAFIENDITYIAKFTEDGTKFLGYYNNNEKYVPNKITVINKVTEGFHYNVLIGIETDDNSIELNRYIIKQSHVTDGSIITKFPEIAFRSDAKEVITEIFMSKSSLLYEGMDIVIPPTEYIDFSRHNYGFIGKWKDFSEDTEEGIMMSKVFLKEFDFSDWYYATQNFQNKFYINEKGEKTSKFKLYQMKDYSFLLYDTEEKVGYLTNNISDMLSWTKYEKKPE